MDLLGLVHHAAKVRSAEVRVVGLLSTFYSRSFWKGILKWKYIEIILTIQEILTQTANHS